MVTRNAVASVFASTAISLCFPLACLAQTKDGAVLGGVAGAVIGGIIGHQNDETPEGALIGGAVGAVAGGILGKQKEQQRQIQYYQQQQAFQAYQQRYATPVYTTHVHSAPVYSSTVQEVSVRRPVSVNDVVTLTRSGVSDAIIANHVGSNGVVDHPSVDDVLTMHDAGVSDFVIDAMQKAPIGSQVVVHPAPMRTDPVVIHQEYQTMPIDGTRPTYSRTPTYYYPSNQRPRYLQSTPGYRRNF